MLARRRRPRASTPARSEAVRLRVAAAGLSELVRFPDRAQRPAMQAPPATRCERPCARICGATSSPASPWTSNRYGAVSVAQGLNGGQFRPRRCSRSTLEGLWMQSTAVFGRRARRPARVVLRRYRADTAEVRPVRGNPGVTVSLRRRNNTVNRASARPRPQTSPPALRIASMRIRAASSSASTGYDLGLVPRRRLQCPTTGFPPRVWGGTQTSPPVSSGCVRAAGVELPSDRAYSSCSASKASSIAST